jgi:serine/threonine-protein kinase
MSLAPGTRLGAYEIVAPVGAGGMGEVYQARDARLGRDVAIKVLPGEVAADPERLVRFEREARVLASLNHPNIATLHGFEAEGAVRFLVMELVPGQTLAERLAPGRLLAPDALPLYLQIAEGLEAAHEAGVVHRDLKPANVKITPEGRVKILDFGLAKAVAGVAEASGDRSKSPTLTALATQRGEIMGTAAYMSPEQVRGKPVDRRADIWAFGAVLYEALAGRRPFLGETITDVLAAIVKDEPDWTTLPDDLPPPVGDLLRRCLVKDARDRLRDIGEARLSIARALGRDTSSGTARALSTTGPTSGPAVAAADSAKGRSPLPLAVAAAALVGVAAGAALVAAFGPGAAPREAGGIVRLLLEAPSGIRAETPRITPDGRTVVYYGASREDMGAGSAVVRLYARSLESWESRPLAETEGAFAFALSPDGQWLAVAVRVGVDSTKRRVIKIPLDGSAPPLSLADWSDGWDEELIWMPDGDLLAASSGTGSLIRIHTDGSGVAEPVKLAQAVPPGGLTLRGILPDGRVLATIQSWAGGSYHDETLLLDAASGEARTLIADAANPRWSTSGHLLFTRRDTLLAARFEPGSAAPGPPVAIASGLRLVGANAGAWFDLSRSGVLVYQPGGHVSGRRRLAIADADANVVPWSDDRLAFIDRAALSPDGRHLAVTVMREDWYYTIWTSEFDRPQLRLLVAEPQMDCDNPVWLQSGDRVLHACTGREDRTGIYVSALAGGGARRRVRADPGPHFLRPTSVSPDGAYALLETKQGDLSRLLLLPLAEDAAEVAESEMTPLLPADERASDAAFSPDGRWIAYASRASGRMELRVRPFLSSGEVGPATVVALSPQTFALWSGLDRDGAPVLTYSATRDRVVSVSVRGGPAATLSEPRSALDLSQIEPKPIAAAPLPDGRLLLTRLSEEEQGTGQILIVLNWLEELERLAPRAH